MISFAASVLGGAVSVMFVKVVDQSYLARAGAIFNASATAATPVGSVLVSVMALKLNPAILIAVSAILAIVLFVLIAISSLKFEMKEDHLNAAEGV